MDDAPAKRLGAQIRLITTTASVTKSGQNRLYSARLVCSRRATVQTCHRPQSNVCRYARATPEAHMSQLLVQCSKWAHISKRPSISDIFR